MLKQDTLWLHLVMEAYIEFNFGKMSLDTFIISLSYTGQSNKHNPYDDKDNPYKSLCVDKYNVP